MPFQDNSEQPFLSVVIPAYNRIDVVDESIKALFNQSLESGKYEIVVVDDRSTDGTAEVLSKLSKRFPFNFYRNNENKGPAATRNLGVQKVRGELILFLDIDIIAVPELLERHYQWHLTHLQKEYTLVGRTLWHTDLEITPFMRWLERGGPMVDFRGIKDNAETNFLSFYTGNVSLKKKFFIENGGFDEAFSSFGSPAYEDTELGLRLEKAGMRLFYSSKALGYHKDSKSLKDSCARRYQYGKMSPRFRQKHPEIENYFRDDLKYNLTKTLVNGLTMKILEPLAKFFESRLYFPLLFWLVCRHYYNQGIYDFYTSEV